MTEQRDLRRDIVWGVRVGAWIALVYSLLFLAILLLRGGIVAEHRGLKPAQVLLFYLMAGPLGGLIVGTLRPLGRRRIGAAVIGAVVMLPLIAGAATLFEGSPAHWDRATFGAILLIALTAGPIFGWVLWEEP